MKRLLDCAIGDRFVCSQKFFEIEDFESNDKGQWTRAVCKVLAFSVDGVWHPSTQGRMEIYSVHAMVQPARLDVIPCN